MITDRNYALAADALLPAFKEVVRLLGEDTLFPCTNNQQATKARKKTPDSAAC